ncbi:MAG: hypothetical protein J0G34_15185 [Afipia sp.]|nr:hypothetical protein [Afipia sp.]
MVAAVTLGARGSVALDYQRSGASQISRPLSGIRPSGLRDSRSFCNSIRYGPCVPRAGHLLGDTLQVTVLSRPDAKNAPDYIKPDHELNTIADLFMALRACWTPPLQETSREGLEMSVRFSLKRDGDLIGPPRITYVTDGVSQHLRDIYFNAVTASLDGCMPFALTKGFGNAIVGQPMTIRYIDNRVFEPEKLPAKP